MPQGKKTQAKEMFAAADVKMLSHAVSIYPNLEFACYATKLAKERLKFPVKSYQEIAPLFSVKEIPEKIARRGLRPAHMRKFFAKQFFPIEDARDFLGKTLAALSWGDVVHHHEQFLKHPERFAPTTLLKER